MAHQHITIHVYDVVLVAPCVLLDALVGSYMDLEMAVLQAEGHLVLCDGSELPIAVS